MNQLNRSILVGLLAGACLTACGSSGGEDDFQLLSISVPPNAQWQINRPIEFEFSEPVDFTTVDSNSIAIQTPTGQAALGTYFVKTEDDGTPIPNVVVFQPRCPLLPDFSDAGLIPGGQSYQVRVLGADISIGLAVAAQDGDVLTLSQSRTFSTALGTDASDLFIDSALGAPTVVLRAFPNSDDEFDGTHIRLRDTGERRYFDLFSGVDPADLPPGVSNGDIVVEDFSGAEPDFPINLFSDPAQQIDVVLVFNQPVSPNAANISSENLTLQSRPAGGGPWVDRAAEVTLEANCTATGARVRVRPTGILPQLHDVRVVVSADFADIIGDQGLLAQANFSRFETQVFPSPYGDAPGADPAPETIVDEIFESFAAAAGEAGSIEDPSAVSILPSAEWGQGRLQAAFNFEGNGGPEGTFDYRVPAGPDPVILSTDFVQILGGPGFTETAVQNVENGVLEVRNLLIEEGAELRFIGPNPVQIFATGSVTINGTIDVSGVDSVQVNQLNSPQLPQPGAAGSGGGGDGGIGSPFTNSSSPKGGNGLGPFQVANGGGVGGESGFNDTMSDSLKRGGGGGGGRLAPDFPNAFDGAFQVNARLGGFGAEQATGAINLDPSIPPQPGAPGPVVFNDLNPDGTLNASNDFFGTQSLAGDGSNLILGELTAPLAGSGGGGGGDSIRSAVFPSTDFLDNMQLMEEEKGGSGGGGAGQLQILALENVKLGANARVTVNGGRGGEGESTGGTNQIGGGGAGGSGGHVIIQAGRQLDLSDGPAIGAIQALGGEGAEGAGDGTNDTTPAALGSGGDGGGGIIQFHVEQFLNPVAVAGGNGVVLPVGEMDVLAYIESITAPNAKTLVPTFSPRSVARSLPIPLGSIDENTPMIPPLFALLGVLEDDPLTPLTDESGTVISSGNEVTPLEPLFSDELPNGGVLASINEDTRVVTIALDGAAIAALSDEANGVEYEYCADGLGVPVDCDDPMAVTSESFFFLDDTYFRNPALLREALLVLDPDGGGPIGPSDYTVAMATFMPDDPSNPGAGQSLTLFLNGEGSFANFVGDGELDVTNVTFDLSPRSFRISTATSPTSSVSSLDELLDSQTVQIQAQALRANEDGLPDLETPLTGFTGNFMELSAPSIANETDFLRFEVLFDLGAGADGETPRPRLEFLRVPIRF